jgi:hypothetical protein
MFMMVEKKEFLRLNAFVLQVFGKWQEQDGLGKNEHWDWDMVGCVCFSSYSSP